MGQRSRKVRTATPLVNVFSSMHDPRSTRGRKHPLVNVVVIAICGVICGADSWVGIEEWAEAKEQWLAGFLDMSEGVPSHDTLGRVFAVLSPKAFQEAFTRWVEGLDICVEGRVVAIDGKTLRRSHDKSRGRAPIHMVNAWCTALGVSLGQVTTDEKSNEITAIPELLEQLMLEGAIVTIDAMGCQKNIASAIRDRGGDYLLAVKNNHPTLLADIQARFDSVLARDIPLKALHTAESSERGHGRHDERTTYVLPVPKGTHGREDWRDLRSIVMVESVRTVDGKSSCNHRFYISSLTPRNAQRFHDAAREHWGVENGLHWVLDLAFREDESRVRIGHAAENLGRIRQMALNLLKQDKSVKLGIKNKRLRAGWDEAYLRKLLALQRVDGSTLQANG